VPEGCGNSAHANEKYHGPVPGHEPGEHHGRGCRYEGNGKDQIPVLAETVAKVADEKIGGSSGKLTNSTEHSYAECCELIFLFNERKEHRECGDVPMLEAMPNRDGGDVSGTSSSERRFACGRMIDCQWGFS
jgi:hypothetical protein